MSIKIIIDSASDYTVEEAKKDGLTVVPLSITFPDGEFFDGTELSREEFYKRLTTQDFFPKTSQVNPHAFKEVFSEELKSADELLVITLSSKLSGTYASAVSAAEKNNKIYVFDSQNVTAGLYLIIKYAVKLRDEGRCAGEIFELLTEMRPYVCTIGLLDTLKYLKKGGRISGAAAIAGSFLNLKPYAEVKNGKIEIAGKARGHKRGMSALLSMIKSEGIDERFPLVYAYAGLSSENAEELKKLSSSIIGGAQVFPTLIIGSTIGTHVGPGAAAIGFFKKH